MRIADKAVNIINHEGIYGEIYRYLIVGGTAFVFDYGALLLLNKAFGLNYLIAATIAFTIGITVNYIGSIFFVFKVRSLKNEYIERAIFIMIGILGLLLNDVMLFLLTGKMFIPVEYSKLITQIVVLFWNFAARKLILFNKGGRNESG